MNEEILREADHRCHIVQLIPYQHQVGGHVGLLSYDEQTVCKPLNEQECKVYRYLPEELKEFIPQFCGVVKVHFEKCGDDILCFALPSDCSYCKDKKRLKHYLLATKAIPLEESLEPHEGKTENGKGIYSWNSRYANFSIQEELHKRWLDNYSCTKLEKFIKLECISKRFKFPCIIDLKMGTRGHGDFVSQEKKERKEKRIYNSTSRTLGVRLCGMQIYRGSSGEYAFIDKYDGRNFTDEEFKKCLQDFLYNGMCYRTELIQPIIQRLETLRKNLQSIEGYRFYCSSLLLMYDGYKIDQSDSIPDILNQSDTFPEVEVRMIDFANARLKEEESNTHIGPDQGYIFGVTSLIKLFTELRQHLSNNKFK